MNEEKLKKIWNTIKTILMILGTMTLINLIGDLLGIDPIACRSFITGD